MNRSATPRFPAFLHGGDYNPEQWLKYPEILEKDVELMREAKVNCVSLGIFSWAFLEPEEGVYDFAWMDRVIERLWSAGIHVDLATPSGARPAWLAEKYPEVLRVDDRFHRQHFGGRHNHCPSSPVYQEKVRAIDTALARRYAHHPAVILWHISNEFSGDCRCPLCQDRFRAWLQDRYGSLEALNDHWWTGFWSMRYTSWSQVEPPSHRGQNANPAIWVDWRRFSTWQCRSFIEMEKAALHAVNPDIPVTANLMHRFWDYDYFELAKPLDVVSWDSYPAWGMGDDLREASEHAMTHDLMRSLKDRPFLLMESTPSQVNWHDVNKLKKPGMHLLSSMLALGQGSQSVMYFQWRKGRGGAEMFHGAVVGHDGTADTRTFRQVRQVGDALERLAPLYGAEKAPARVCILYDWNNLWALDYAQMGRRGDMRYTETVNEHYRALWKLGVNMDFRDCESFADDGRYQLVIAPMLFMTRAGIEEKLRAFVARGGTLLMTAPAGTIGEDGLAHLGQTPHGLTDVLGIRALELDALTDTQENRLIWADGPHRLLRLCELIQAEGAQVLGTYGEDFYAGSPCLTRHDFGKGQAYYLAAQTEEAFLTALYRRLVESLAIPRALPGELPDGVAAQERGGAVFLQNYAPQARQAAVPGAWQDLLTGDVWQDRVELEPLGIRVLVRK
ncbi:MAG: beta-galactosidase [Clostridia bacterium]|nr:beta-galactosidase [Clostridia bacterium]